MERARPLFEVFRAPGAEVLVVTWYGSLVWTLWSYFSLDRANLLMVGSSAGLLVENLLWDIDRAIVNSQRGDWLNELSSKQAFPRPWLECRAIF
mmetsp:Transcript_44909/g.174303  ORF Transcript_44909/g.174303 Transcript_44909/m.174303 type:complete len:94 (-) Transcript_44909:1793-2074(-)